LKLQGDNNTLKIKLDGTELMLNERETAIIKMISEINELHAANK
jgi:hypothetical protein